MRRNRRDVSVVQGRHPFAWTDLLAAKFGDVSAADAGSYSVVVSGGVGNVGDQQREPDGEPELVVASAPVSLTNCPGTSASFSVSATGRV